MKLWDGSYLSTKGVRSVSVRPTKLPGWTYQEMCVGYEDGRCVVVELGDSSYVEQIEAFAKEAGL